MQLLTVRNYIIAVISVAWIYLLLCTSPLARAIVSRVIERF